jgi:membrane protease YdiL (CAAX protease family)
VIFSLCILAVVLIFTWVLAPIAPRWATAGAVALVLGLATWRAIRTGEWGIRRSAFLPSLGWSAVFTGAGAFGIYLAGSRLRTWHDRGDLWTNLAVLIPWGLGQQFALHTVFLREAQATVSRPAGIWFAALMFATLHLPNPFLTVMTGVGALAWCWIYDRHPNLLPLALSHALLTLAVLYAFDDAITGRLRVGLAYLDLR